MPKVYAGTENQRDVAGSTWKKELPCRAVQHHFVNTRTRELNAEWDKLREEAIEIFKTDTQFAPKLRGRSKEDIDWFCYDAYNHLTAVLQSRDLTINLKARSWFLTENRYDSYAQMYEKAVDKTTGEMILDDSDKKNPANVRAETDDKVTFPTGWQGAGVNPSQRGLTPRFQPSPQRIMGRMYTGDLRKTPVTPKVNQYRSENALFNPKTKQVFAALDYGRRPHGASIFYGKSYFVLEPSLKVNALYFPADTFCLENADMQVSYQTLGAILVKAHKRQNRAMINCLVAACLNKMRLPDTTDPGDLLEAHIFEKLTFQGNMKELHVSLDPNDVKEEDAGIDAGERLRDMRAIRRNAQTFCNKWGISYFETD